ncbi:dUTP diphosphatase [Mesorhizobium sp.]|uniref:dUTP diphosphatase n=1 Tax=Mesorhizobium sp. TaxID=1871066 RepID=UPI000FE2D1D3|nr:dUTP diphosphatase [Mesorhizobium sp.]RWJ03426.1 MAG: dUTP diphosphatase [Mesorhizobium sp.]
MLVGTDFEIVNVGWQKLHPDAKVPVYGSDEAAGADLCAIEGVWLKPNEITLVKTGIAIELPKGVEAQVRPRSGLALRHGVTVVNAPGTIDSDYRGEIGVVLTLVGRGQFAGYKIEPGDRIAQLVIAPVLRAKFLATGGVLSETKRGAGGFGSTGAR